MLTALAAAALTLAQPAPAPDTAVVDFRWFGSLRCSDWHADKRADGDTGNALKTQWVMGFLSGRGALRNKGLLETTDGNQVSAWLDKYCHEHPLDGMVEASYRLETELIARAR